MNPPLTPAMPIAALVYGEGGAAAAALDRVRAALELGGYNCAGLVQRDSVRAGRARCDMDLEDVATGQVIRISQDRGPHARGCLLDMGELLRAIELGRASLADARDVLLLNKFGKAECEGGGLRPLIEEAIASGVPVLIGVPARNLDAWRAFAGEFASEFDAEACARDPRAVLDHLGAAAGNERVRERRETAA